MHIRGIEQLTVEEREQAEAAGARYVFFEYCISLVFITLRKPSAVYFLRSGERGLVRGLRYTVVSLLLGWWGIPWGLIYTPLTLITNLTGGCDVTGEVVPLLRQEAARQ